MIVTKEVGEVIRPDYPKHLQREFLGDEGLNVFCSSVALDRRGGDKLTINGASFEISIGTRSIVLHQDHLGLKAYMRKVQHVLTAINFYLTAYDEFRQDVHTPKTKRVATRIYRKFLNSGGTSSGGTVFVYVHRTYFKVKGDPEFRKDIYAFIELADCMYKIRLYNPLDRTKPDQEIVKLRDLLAKHVEHINHFIPLQGKTYEEIKAILSATA